MTKSAPNGVATLERVADTTKPKAPPSLKTVALVGHAPSTKMMAPFDDGGVEIWTMNDAFPWIPRADQWFEIHDRSVYDNNTRRTAGYLDHLANFHGPVWMQYPDERIPNAKPFDMQGMQDKYGTVFGSSFAWMIAKAIEDGYKRIELYGCDLASQTEYEEQRESTTFWIGMARGMGIEFYLPVGCPLLTRPSYGLPQPHAWVSREFFDNRMGQIRKAQGETAAKLNHINGMIEVEAFYRSVLEGKTKAPGVQLPPIEQPLSHPANVGAKGPGDGAR